MAERLISTQRADIERRGEQSHDAPKLKHNPRYCAFDLEITRHACGYGHGEKAHLSMGLQKGADVLRLFILLLMQRTLVTSCQALTFNIYPFGSAKVMQTCWCDFKSSDNFRLTERMNHDKISG